MAPHAYDACRKPENSGRLRRGADNTGAKGLQNRIGGVFARLAVDADIVDGCARHPGDIKPGAEHAGKIAIAVDVRPAFGLPVAADLAAVAAIGFDPIVPAAELAADVEARIEGRRVSLEAPFWYPIGPVAGRREKVPIPLCPALRGNAFADELHCHLRSELIGVCPVAILVREHADVRERLNSAPLHSTLILAANSWRMLPLRPRASRPIGISCRGMPEASLWPLIERRGIMGKAWRIAKAAEDLQCRYSEVKCWAMTSIGWSLISRCLIWARQCGVRSVPRRWTILKASMMRGQISE